MFIYRLNILLSLILIVLLSIFINEKYLIPVWILSGIIFLYFLLIIDTLFFHIFLTNKDFEGKRLRSKLKYYFAYSLAVIYSKLLFRTKFIFINKEKFPKGNKFTIFANHKSNTDPAAIFMLMKHRPIAYTPKSELSKVFMFNKWLRSVGSFFIYRDSPKNTVKELLYGIDNAKKGLPYCIFLEGGITNIKTDLITDFKPGAMKIVEKAETDILPISYTNSRFTRYRFPFLTKIYVTIGDLIKYDEIKHLNSYELAELVKNKINQNIYTKMEG